RTGSDRPMLPQASPPADSAETMPPGFVREAVPRRIRINGPAGRREAQLSGLAWWGDRLLLLPQYPGVQGDTVPVVYAVHRSDLTAAVDRSSGDRDSPGITPQAIPVDATSLAHVPGYQGVEAVTVAGRTVFATVEATRKHGGGSGMRAFVGKGAAGASPRPALSFSETKEVPVPVAISNMAYEALVHHDGALVALFEANGANVNAAPAAIRLTEDLQLISSLPMPSLEYRLTDATNADSAGRFWVTNYLYEGEVNALNPATDSVAMEHGIGWSHRNGGAVERLVELQITGSQIRRTETPPIWIARAGTTGRNWEGVVRFGEGFLLVTDTFPETVLAYVPCIPAGVRCHAGQESSTPRSTTMGR
ncbi:hypothetical protein, partial [Longibacter sp.]|uniref:hypothetical protein n=1 Tax=Longibacter sp. TaxID=2045415 RepID=UPI003EBE1D32